MLLTDDHMAVLEALPDPVVVYDLQGVIAYVNSAFTRQFGWTFEQVVGTQQTFNAGDVPDMDSAQRLNRQGSVIDVQATRTPLLNHSGQAIAQIVTLRDITERLHMEQSAIEQRNLAEALNEITLALNSTLELSSVLDLLLISVGRVVPHDLAFVKMVDASVARVVGCRDWTSQRLERHLIGKTLDLRQVPRLRQMQETGLPLIIDDIRDLSPHPDLLALSGMAAYLGAPITRGREVIGFIALQHQRAGFFTRTHAVRLQTFANQAALAMVNAQQYAQAQELAALSERQRLARDLHDAVSQTLFSAKVMAETLQLQFAQGHLSEVPDKLERLRQLTQGALSEMRTLLLELRPEALVQAEISDLLAYLVNTMAGRRSSLEITLDVDETCELPAHVKLAFYRIAQEAVNNILRHAQPNQASLMLGRSGKAVQLCILDDGLGFDAKTTKAGHFGLQNMRERAVQVGASLTIDSRPGEGTRICVRWEGEDDEQ